MTDFNDHIPPLAPAPETVPLTNPLLDASTQRDTDVTPEPAPTSPAAELESPPQPAALPPSTPAPVTKPAPSWTSTPKPAPSPSAAPKPTLPAATAPEPAPSPSPVPASKTDEPKTEEPKAETKKADEPKPASAKPAAETPDLPAATSPEPPARPVPSSDAKSVQITELLAQRDDLKRKLADSRKEHRSAVKKRRQESGLKPYQVELLKLQKYLEEHERRMIVLFEGRDAAGKGGTIRRVTRYMNEKHYRVVALGKPTEEQRGQWYFQRYVAQFPTAGEMVLFDRSWYNRAMVEPVFGFCTPEEHKNFLRGVTGFEKDLVRQGTILVKLYFSVTKEEQKRRFDRRRTDPLRQWKLSEVDMQAQEHWDDFTDRKYEMLKRTSTSDAPWTIIRSEDKHLARLNAMRVILNAAPYEGRNTDIEFVPDHGIVLSGAEEVALMEAERIRGGRFTH